MTACELLCGAGQENTMLTQTAHCDGSSLGWRQVHSFPKRQGQSDVADAPSMACGGLISLNGFLEEAADQTGRACRGHSERMYRQRGPRLVHSSLALSFCSGNGYSWHLTQGCVGSWCPRLPKSLLVSSWWLWIDSFIQGGVLAFRVHASWGWRQW